MAAAVFYTDFSDYQQHNYIPAQPANQIYNIDMRLWGAEFQLSRRLSEKLSGYISYTYLDWDADSHPMDTEDTHYLFQTLPQHQGVISLNYRLWEDGLVSLNGKYFGSRLSKREDRMSSVFILDVGAEHTFWLPHDTSFTVRGWVNNVTNQDYQLRYGYDMPGTTAGISGTINF